MAITPRTATVVEGGTTATTVTGSLPSDRQTNDLTIAVFAFSATSSANWTAPSGWTQFVAPVDNGFQEWIAAYYRFNPPSGPQGTSTVAGRMTVICQSYGGVNQTTPIDVTAVSTQQTSGVTSFAATGVNVATAGALLISACVWDTSSRTVVEPVSMTQEAEYSAGGLTSTGRALSLAREVRASSGPSGTRTWSFNPTDVSLAGVAFVTAIRPMTSISLSGTITASGIVNKATTKNAFTGSITASGTHIRLKVVERIFTASITAAGTLAKRTSKALSGSIAPSGAHIKRTNKSMAGSSTPSGVFKKSPIRLFTGSIAVSGNLITTALGRVFGRPGVVSLVIQKAGDVRIRFRRS